VQARSRRPGTFGRRFGRGKSAVGIAETGKLSRRRRTLSITGESGQGYGVLL